MDLVHASTINIGAIMDHSPPVYCKNNKNYHNKLKQCCYTPCIQNIITLLFAFNLKENTITFEVVSYIWGSWEMN